MSLIRCQKKIKKEEKTGGWIKFRKQGKFSWWVENGGVNSKLIASSEL